MVFAIHWHASVMGVHMSPILSPLSPPSSFHPSGLSQCTGFERPVSCIQLGLVICFTYGNIHVSMLFHSSLFSRSSKAKTLYLRSPLLLGSSVSFGPCQIIPLTWDLMSRRAAEVILHELLADNCSEQGYSFAATEFTRHCTASWQEHMHYDTKYKIGASILRFCMAKKSHAERRAHASAMKQGQTEAKVGVLCQQGRGWKAEPDPCTALQSMYQEKLLNLNSKNEIMCFYALI